MEESEEGLPWTARERARLLIYSANAHLELDDVQRAREVARDALRIDPTSRSVRRWYHESGLAY